MKNNFEEIINFLSIAQNLLDEMLNMLTTTTIRVMYVSPKLYKYIAHGYKAEILRYNNFNIIEDLDRDEAEYGLTKKSELKSDVNDFFNE